MYALLYADDTLLLAETEQDLQNSFKVLYEYCNEIMLSRGIVKKLPKIQYGDNAVEVVKEYTYLGLKFYCNGKLNKAIEHLCSKATRSMFALLKNGRKHNLPIDVQLHLFSTTVLPILLYGSEIWGCENIEPVERVQLRFLKLLMGLKSSTPSVMVYRELGYQPLKVTIERRAIGYWSHLVAGKETKVSHCIYQLLRRKCDMINSKWIKYIENALNDVGFCNIWASQTFSSVAWLQNAYALRVNDQYKQQFFSDIAAASKCTL